MTAPHQQQRIEQLLGQLEQLFVDHHVPSSTVATFDGRFRGLLARIAQHKNSEEQQRQQEQQQAAMIKQLEAQLSGAPSAAENSWLQSLLSQVPSLGLLGGAAYGSYQLAQQYQEARRHVRQQPCPVVFYGPMTELAKYYTVVREDHTETWANITRNFGPLQGSCKFNGQEILDQPEGAGPVLQLVFIRDEGRAMWLPDPVSPHGEFHWIKIESGAA